MGNRATVVFEGRDETQTSAATYMHWNGGPETVYPVLDCMVEFKVRGFDQNYACARFTQIVANFIDGILSVGVGDAGPRTAWPEHLDPGDNGLYVVRWTGGLDYTVRRCIYGRWLTAAEVAAERTEAAADRYSDPSQGETIAAAVRRTSGAFFLGKDNYQNPSEVTATRLPKATQN